MKSLDLDSLLGDKYTHATFHDAKLEAINVCFLTGTAELKFLIPCGFLPDEDCTYQSGTLEFQGLLFYFVEPARFARKTDDKSSLWITSNGALPNKKVRAGVELPDDLPDDAFAHYFYSSSTNSFIVIAAQHGVFRWQ